jgi:serine phosphatase RsbU (regulator of sigma subunit)
MNTRATDRLPRVLPGTDDVAGTAAGVLVAGIGGGGDFLAWFRPETLREVTWGGDPYSPKIVEDERGPRLSPRRSFAAWSEIVRGTAEPWREHEVTAVAELAAHVARARLDRADEDDLLAGVLQRTLLLEQLPDIPGVALAARYVASSQDVVGGDWYDLVLLPSGRVSVVLGDVAGHRLSAASTTAQLRHALRAHLLRDLGPAVALQALNDLVTRLLPEELATAVVAELEPSTGELAIANAGHLPVLHVRREGSEYLEADRGPALGLVADSRYGQTSVRLARDDRLLLVSDGLLERRGASLDDGLAALLAAADRLREAAPQELCDGVLAELAPPDTDDVTLVGLGLR